MARAQGARAQMAMGFEPVYGVSPAPSSFWKMPFVSTTLGSDQPLLSSDLLGYGRDPLAPVKDAVTADGDVVIPIDNRFFALWLQALFGEPETVTQGDLHLHTFQSGGYDLPSMSIEVGNPEVPSYRMLTGVKANTVTWQMQRSGLVTATLSCIAQGEEPSAPASAVPAPVELGVDRFSSFNGVIVRDGAVLGNVVSGSVTYTNGLEAVETIRSDGKIDGADEGMAVLSGEIVVRFADTVLLEQAHSGEPITLRFGYQVEDGASLVLIAHAVYLPRPRIPLSGPAGVQVTFAWQAAKALDGGPMATVLIVNDMASLSIAPPEAP